MFVKSGETIKGFNKSKGELIKQTEIGITQIQKLSSDLKENNVQINVVQPYYNSERGLPGAIYFKGCIIFKSVSFNI